MKIVVINLLRDKDKRERAKKILDEYNVDYQFLEAIDGAKIPDDYYNSLDSSLINSYRGTALTKAEVGIYLSHINIYNNIVAENINDICVLEDDFVFSDEFQSFLESYDSIVNNADFDILMIGHFLAAKSKGIIVSFFNRNKYNGVNICKPLEFNYGAHAYVIKLSGAMKMLEKFKEPKCPIDNILGLCELYGLKRLVTETPIVFQSKDFISSIQTVKYLEDLDLIGYCKRTIKTLLFHCSNRYITYNLEKYRIV